MQLANSQIPNEWVVEAAGHILQNILERVILSALTFLLLFNCNLSSYFVKCPKCFGIFLPGTVPFTNGCFIMFFPFLGDSGKILLAELRRLYNVLGDGLSLVL